MTGLGSSFLSENDVLGSSFRNWDGYFESFEGLSNKIIDFDISSADVIANHYSTQPLTVTNNLEGGSGGSYQVTWQNANSNIQIVDINSDEVYNAFNYSDNLDYYKITIDPSFSVLNTTWYFQNWDDGTTNLTKENITVSSPRTFTANYKGISRSDNENAYKNNGQRKLIQTPGGKLYHVYDSMGKVWFEVSEDNGVTWDFHFVDEGRNPTINFNTYPSYGIIYEKDNGSATDLKWAYVYFSGIEYSFYFKGTLVSNVQSAGSNLEAVFGTTMGAEGTSGSYDYFVTYRRAADWGGNTAGLYYVYGAWTPVTPSVSASGKISNTTSSDYNPAIAVCRSGDYIKAHIVYQHGTSSIYYNSILAYFHNISSQYGPENVSYGCGYTYNYNPSITVLANTLPHVSWIGKRKVIDGGVSKESALTVSFEMKVLNRSRFYYNNSWGTAHIYGNDAITTVISSDNLGTNNDYIIAWTENDGDNKYVTSDAITTQKSLSTSGNYIQAANSDDLNDIYLTVFSNQTAPFKFETVHAAQGINKINTNGLRKGREGIVSRDSVEFYFQVSDINVNNESIDFVDVHDSTKFNTLAEFNSYLTT